MHHGGAQNGPLIVLIALLDLIVLYTNLCWNKSLMMIMIMMSSWYKHFGFVYGFWGCRSSKVTKFGKMEENEGLTFNMATHNVAKVGSFGLGCFELIYFKSIPGWILNVLMVRPSHFNWVKSLWLEKGSPAPPRARNSMGGGEFQFSPPLSKSETDIFHPLFSVKSIVLAKHR